MKRTAWLTGGLLLAATSAGADSDFSSIPLPAFPLCATAIGPALAQAVEARPPVLVEGLGYSGIESHSSNEEARRWFDQGIRFIWAFDEAEAVRAFREAQKLDPSCALCFWGEAWALSPTINLTGRLSELPAARAAAAKAVELGAGLPAKERGLIAAMQRRTAGAEFDGKTYARAVERLARQFPADDAIAVIAADARMQVMDADTLPSETKPQRLLEGVLKRNPDHSGAIHFYIHLTDWMDRQALAEPYADRLGRIAPAASHLVHMPSHTFYGVGRYADAMAANVAAIAADGAYAAKAAPPPTDYRAGLNAHNTNFVIGSALMIGDGERALATARSFAEIYAKGDPARGQFAVASIYYAQGMYGAPADVLALPEPSDKAPLLRMMRHYARGEALARSGDVGGVRAEAAAIATARATTVFPPSSAAWGEAVSGIAMHVLEGRAAMLSGNPAAAETAFRKAMAMQRKAGLSSDPPTWWYPVRRSVAAALIARGEHGSARNQLIASLRRWPNDPVALHLLAKAEEGLGRAETAATHRARARAAWKGDLDRLPLSAA